MNLPTTENHTHDNPMTTGVMCLSGIDVIHMTPHGDHILIGEMIVMIAMTHMGVIIHGLTIIQVQLRDPEWIIMTVQRTHTAVVKLLKHQQTVS